MRKINVYERYPANLNGTIVTREIKGTILPIGIGELLDERLDEATITVINDVHEKYKPLTEIRIRIEEVEEGEIYGEVFNYYFLVASDNATRVFPRPGITRTKHELYLVERTKLLEGVVCPSLTFTNTLADEVVSEDKGIQEVNFVMQDENNVTLTPTLNEGEYFNNLKAKTLYLPAKIPPDYIFPSPFAVANENAENLVYANVWNDPGAYDWLWATSNFIQIFRSSDPNTPIAKKEYLTSGDKTEQKALLLEPFSPIVPLDEGHYIIEYYLIFAEGQSSNGLNINPIGCLFRYFIEVVEGVKASKITITDVVQRTLSCAEPIDSDAVENTYPNPFSQRFRFNAQQTEQYRQVLAPEFTLTEGTLREQLRTIGGYIHGEPYVDENNVVYFLDLGKEEEAAISGKDVYLSSSWDVNSFCTGIKTYGENLIKSLEFAGGATLEPPSPFTKALRSEKMYARIDEESCAFETSYPIYSVEKLYCGLRNINGSWRIEPKDITRYVYEQTIYNTLSGYEETISGAPLETKSRAIYYARNSKFIKGLTYRQPPDEGTSAALFSEYSIANILSMVSSYTASEIDEFLMQRLYLLEFRIEYIPLLPVLLEHGKNFIDPINATRLNEHGFTQIYNQSDTVIEAASFGENIKGVAARLGNHELEQTFMLRSLADIPKVGEIYKGYAISATYSEIMPKNIKCTVALTKDFNRISQYIGVPSHRRLFEISETNSADRRILIHNTLRISDHYYDYSRKRTGAPLVFTENAVYSIMRLFTDEVYSLSNGVVVSNPFPVIGKINNVFTQPLINNGSNILLPATPVALGNSLSVSFAFADNYSAGAQAAKNTRLSGTQYFQRDTRYTDKYGRIDDLVFHLIDTPTRIIEDNASNVAQLSHTLPLIKGSVPPVNQRLEYDLGFAKYHVQKDNRERLFIASQLEAKTDIEGLFIGSGLMQLCSMHYGNTIKPSDVRLYLIIDKEELPRRFDTTYIRSLEDDSESERYMIFTLGDIQGDGIGQCQFECGISSIADGYDVTIESNGFVPTNYTNGAVGWVLARKPVITTKTVTAMDGTRFEQTIEEGGEILLHKIGYIAPGETIVPTMHFYITNE